MNDVKIEAVVYDYDGLLVDTEDAWFRACQRVCALYEVAVTEEHRLDLMRSQLTAYLVERFELPIRADELRPELYRTVNEILGDTIQTLPGAIESIDLLGQHYPLAIGTGSRTSQVEQGLARLGIRDRFTTVVGSDQVANGKPAPDTYLRVAENLGVLPAACVILEDNPNGVQSAKTAGSSCIAVPNKLLSNADYSQADLVIPSLGHISIALIHQLESSS